MKTLAQNFPTKGSRSNIRKGPWADKQLPALCQWRLNSNIVVEANNSYYTYITLLATSYTHLEITYCLLKYNLIVSQNPSKHSSIWSRGSTNTRYGSSTCTIPFPKLCRHVWILPPAEEKSQTNRISSEPCLIHHYRHLPKMTSIFNYSFTDKFQKRHVESTIVQSFP